MRIVREAVKRAPSILLVGAALTVIYVVTATLLGWDGWLIAVVGLGLGFAYSLIATPLALGPSLRPKVILPEHGSEQLSFTVPGEGSIAASARTVVRKVAVGSVWTPMRHGNGAPNAPH